MNSPLYSWGRYPKAPQKGQRLHWRSDLEGQLNSIVRMHGSTLPFGNGRSYGDSCLAASDHVLSIRGLDRFIQTDWDCGVLIAEAGVTLAEILAIAIPQGWFLSVTPGTQFVTLGGAVANDVHGKNHHVRGTFGNHVLRFGLKRHDQEELICSLEDNAELFSATIGGLGLTGVITWVEIRLIPITTSEIDTTLERFGHLAEFFSLSTELDNQHEYSVAWVDCIAKGNNTGRGVFMAGNHAQYGKMGLPSQKKIAVPLTPPISLVNNLTLRVFNEAYWRMHPVSRSKLRSGYEQFFYPLDRVLHWNRIYGRKGFQQYQCVVPDAAAEITIRELLKAIADSGQGSFLAVLKRCGDIASPGLMSFPMPGTTLALDFPQKPDLVKRLFPRLDSIVREAGGRLYPAKDAHMSNSDFRQYYPAWEKLESLRDPALNSRFWKRVTT